jgi:DNA-binding beta-propeller fold protein YncE
MPSKSLRSGAAVLLLFSSTFACQRAASRGQTVGLEFGTVLSDPARNDVLVGENRSGRVLGLASDDASLQRTGVAGNSIAGLAFSRCFDLLYVSLVTGRRIDVFDAESLSRLARMEIGSPTYEIAPGASGHVLALTDLGLLDLGIAGFQTTPLKPDADPHGRLLSDRNGTAAWLVESKSGEILVTRFDLTDLAAPPVTTPAGALPGEPIGAELSFDGDRLYVGTDGDAGVYVLDGATLGTISTIELGPGLAAISVNETGTRMYTTLGGLLVQSLRLDGSWAAGRDTIVADGAARGGLHVTPDNDDVFVFSPSSTVAAYDLFDVHLDGPTALREERDYVFEIEGTPNALWWLFVSPLPGYLYLDNPICPDPRFFDQWPPGFFALTVGRFDPSGHSELVASVPTIGPDPIDLVAQVAELPKRGKKNIRIGNPLVVRLLPSVCK